MSGVVCRDLEQLETIPSRQRCMQRTELCCSLAGNSCPLITITNPSPEPHTQRPAVVFTGTAHSLTNCKRAQGMCSCTAPCIGDVKTPRETKQHCASLHALHIHACKAGATAQHRQRVHLLLVKLSLACPAIFLPPLASHLSSWSRSRSGIMYDQMHGTFEDCTRYASTH